jgi:hypothetical protein
VSRKVVTYRNASIFDGQRLRTGFAARFEDGGFYGMLPNQEAAGDVVDLAGDVLAGCRVWREDL